MLYEVITQHDRHRLGHLARLNQREQLEQLVERAKSTRKHDHRLGEIGEPKLAHEKVMEVKTELARHVRVVELLYRNRDRQADVHSARVITSYSIHYTKLYDEIGGRRIDAQHRELMEIRVGVQRPDPLSK